MMFLLRAFALSRPSASCRFLTGKTAGEKAGPSAAGRYLFVVSATAPARHKQVKRNPQDFDGRRAC
ncbi:MAG: hypothetical protein KA401_01950 [Anaerolineae bacterium]|nr:hypothetical protein [Anaerolineae bacterium]